VSSQQPDLIDVIICDEVRQESNGKLLIIGMYLDNMGVPKVPFTHPGLTFLCKWKFQQGHVPAGKFRLLGPSRKTLREGGFSTGKVDDDAAGLILTTLRFQPFQVDELGEYRLVFAPQPSKRGRTIAVLDVHAITHQKPKTARPARGE